MTESKESEKKAADDMAFKNSAVKAISGLVHENKKLREVISESKNSKKKERKQSSASKIQGLQILTNTLGKQKL